MNERWEILKDIFLRAQKQGTQESSLAKSRPLCQTKAQNLNV